ncbi:MAG: glycosyltransferase family 39 protein [Flavobacteriales bacterium]|nr:glycosyltransferase family 39 protein [Flavobacteriales bacterium]
MKHGYRTYQWVLLIAALVIGFALRVHGILVLKDGLSHDESVSYLCAAATEGAYQERIDGMVDSTLVVGDIQAYYTRPATLQLGVVAYDLAHYDIHPPLYFWALHAVHVLFGAGIIGGTLLNLIAEFGVALLMLLIAGRVLRHSVVAWAAVAIWYLSSAVVQIDLEARHYQFLALFALASFLLQERILAGRSSRLQWALFIAVNALGLLTHYYFAFLLLPGAVLMLHRYGLKSPTLRFMGAGLASLGLFFLLFPEVFDFIPLYVDRVKDPADAVGLFNRLRTFLYAALAFFAEVHVLRYGYLILLVAFTGLGIRSLWRIDRRLWTTEHPTVYYGLLMLWTGLFTFALYLIGVSPPHAVGEQYLAYFWPLLAIMTVRVANRVIPARVQGWVLAAHMAQLGISLPNAIAHSEYVQNVLPGSWYARMAESEMVIMDDRKRSGLPRIIRHLPATLPLVIMSKEDPEVATYNAVSFLHLDVEGRPSIEPFLTRMSEAGFGQQAKEQHDHYELISFRRDVLR